MAKSKNGSNPLVDWAEGLEALLLPTPASPGELTTGQLAKVRRNVSRTIERLSELARGWDPVHLPSAVFDPSDPAVMGPMIGLALVAQPRVPLAEVGRFYGSGVYAIYYRGDFDAYAPLKDAEHPIYVGKADPKNSKADSPKLQGTKLADRLGEHAKSIDRAVNLNLEDFECRHMVVASGWQGSAETFLIEHYKPIWNNQTKICYGIGKHGDAATTRANKRSPWDTLHSGRAWADNGDQGNQRSEESIRASIAKHFQTTTLLRSIQDSVGQFFAALQNLGN